MHGSSYTHRLFKKTVPQGHRERKGESYVVQYIEHR